MAKKDKNRTLDTFIKALSDLSNRELKELRAILSRRDAAELLAQMLDSIIKLRSVGENVNSPNRSSAADIVRSQDISSSVDSNLSNHFFSEEFIERILGDKKYLPTTKDVVEAVNRCFGLDEDYEKVKGTEMDFLQEKAMEIHLFTP